MTPLEVDQGDPHVDGLKVLMMYDLYISFFLMMACNANLDLSDLAMLESALT